MFLCILSCCFFLRLPRRRWRSAFRGCADYFFGVVIDEEVRAVVGTVMFVGFNRLDVEDNLEVDEPGMEPRTRFGRCGVDGFCSVVLGRRFCLEIEW